MVYRRVVKGYHSYRSSDTPAAATRPGLSDQEKLREDSV